MVASVCDCCIAPSTFVENRRFGHSDVRFDSMTEKSGHSSVCLKSTMPNLIHKTRAGLLATIFLLLCSSSATAVNQIEFHNDIVPLFTRFGCNAGACHGAAVGRGNFRLSLFGSDPESDYDSVVRHLRGRRINLAVPEESLLLLKPTEQVAHGGGNRFDIDSDAVTMITEWVRNGASKTRSRQFIDIAVTPTVYHAKAPGDSIEVKVTATYSDGSKRDVTSSTVLIAEDDTGVNIDNQLAAITTKRRGRHVVIARYLTEVRPIEVIVPLTDSRPRRSKSISHNFIDEQIQSRLRQLRLPSSPQISDELYLRRATLDLTGRLPTAETLSRFIADDATDKRASLTQSLLTSDGFIEYWTFNLAKLFRLRTQQHDEEGAAVYNQWISEQLRNGIGYDQISRALLVAEGDAHTNGPANFWRTTRNARDQAELASEIFMGSRLRCANCHNHPLDHWTQDDYHGLAAIFAKVQQGVIVQAKPTGRVIHPKYLEPAKPKVPGAQFITGSNTNARLEFAQWLTHPDNPYFSKAIVNRIWKQLMGKGLVEPVDDFRSTNPATHPALLELLARDFVDSGFSIKHTITRITASAAYARSADAIETNKFDDQYYSHAIKVPLDAEVLADAIADVTGIHEQYGEQPIGTRAISLLDPAIPSRTLQVLGRCDRSDSCESTTNAIDGLSQKLHQFNGAMINDRISATNSRLTQYIHAGKPVLEIIESFYQVGLSRSMTDVELAYWTKLTDDLETEVDTKHFLEDFVWSLLSSKEFGTKH